MEFIKCNEICIFDESRLPRLSIINKSMPYILAKMVTCKNYRYDLIAQYLLLKLKFVYKMLLCISISKPRRTCFYNNKWLVI